MNVIQVEHLKRYFKVYKKEPGLGGSIRSFFNRKHYDAKAVDDISFSIKEGELIGFIGPNGAGKTTTLKMLSGLLHPTDGKVNVLGFQPFERKNEYLKQISLVMGQKNQLWWDLPAYDSFLLNKEIYEVSKKSFNTTIDRLSELLDVKDILNVQVRKLSLGQRMKCELIAALIHSPKVLFLDEPTIGLDVVMQQKLRDFIKEYNETFKATVILTSHYMKDVQQLCERIIVINHGKILYDGKLQSIIKEYATHKLITVTLNKKVTTNELEKMGKIKNYEYPVASISVPVKDSNHIASILLDKYPVQDITIEDQDIEEIIRDLFIGKSA